MAMVFYNFIEDYLKINDDFILNIGNFDGIHLGHQNILKTTFEIAKKNNYKKVIITFSNKPALLFKENFINTQIFNISSKIDYLEKLGLDYIFIFEFNSNLKNLTANEFMDLLLKNKHLKAIVIGENFTFGKNKSGNVQILKQYMEKSNIVVNIVPLIYIDGQLISSTMIRQHILSGDFSINKYLIEPFYIIGLVEAGKHHGRLIKFPTANIYIYEQIKPKSAVYATITAYKSEKSSDLQYDYSMTYVGDKGEIETHVFDRNIDLYNKEIRVYFINYMRDNIRIKSLSHLESVLNADKEKILNFFESYFEDSFIDACGFIKKIKGSLFDV